jgi:hypothetical protein
MTVKPFEINSWTIAPCDTGGYTLSRTESHPEPTLEAAVRAAQRYAPGRSLTGSSPEDIDALLQGLVSDKERLAFYQWVGRLAVGEAVAIATRNVSQDPAPPQHRSYSQDTVYEFFELIDPGNKNYEPFPSKLPEDHFTCDVAHHAHPNGKGRLSTCRSDSE